VILRDPLGRIVAHITHGWAQSPCEAQGGRPFTLDTVTPWGSVTKMVTTAAVLNKIKRFDSKSLNDRMVDFLPLRWAPGCDGSGDCWRDVTVRHLMAYQGGFDGAVSGPYSTRLQSGTTERAVGSRKYSNEMFGIWNYMGAFFGEGRMRQIDEAYDGPSESYDAVMFTATRGIWTDYLDNHVYGPLGIRGACAKVDFAGPDHVLLYNYKQGDGADETGYKPNPVDTPNCTSGGIVMSLRDMSVFTHALANTGKVISKRQYRNHLARTDNDVLGWNDSIAADGGRMFFKAGASTKQGGHLGTHSMAFSSGYTAVIATNSFAREGSTWKRHLVIRDAYDAARDAATGTLSSN
jgi:CubicO group peptidase (beta-lactamase class C family)